MLRADEDNFPGVEDFRLKTKEDLRGQISFRFAEAPQPNEPEPDARVLYSRERYEIY
jgi:hypothetical protein